MAVPLQNYSDFFVVLLRTIKKIGASMVSVFVFDFPAKGLMNPEVF